MFAHSARASEDGMKAYVSYWDLGVLTFDISDPANPVLLTRTTFEESDDGDAHSMTPYVNKRGREFILQNDEDTSPRSPAEIRYGKRGQGIGVESAGSAPLWLERKHKVAAPVVMAANQGCAVADYPVGTAGKIAVAYTPFPFFDASGDEPLCLQRSRRRPPKLPAPSRSSTTSSPRTRARSGSTSARSASPCSSPTTRPRRGWSPPASRR